MKTPANFNVLFARVVPSVVDARMAFSCTWPLQTTVQRSSLGVSGKRPSSSSRYPLMSIWNSLRYKLSAPNFVLHNITCHSMGKCKCLAPFSLKFSADKRSGWTGNVPVHSAEREFHGCHSEHQQAGRWVCCEWRRRSPSLGGHESPEMRVSFFGCWEWKVAGGKVTAHVLF